MNILVTGGAGYIGSHTVVELMERGHEVVITDNFVNSRIEVLERLKRITGKGVPHYRLDVRDETALSKVFEQHTFDGVIHFAGLKAVGESKEQPLRYYRNNLDALLVLCEIMALYKVKHLVFSSSATVYGEPDRVPITEDFPLRGTNPYGETKLMGEQILRDVAASDPDWRITLLRYFNPIGAHTSGLIGEDPNGIPNNLVPYISQVAVGQRDILRVWGDDYPTKDGTGVRDYIHVVDLARAHIKALEHDFASGVATYNIGTGHGYSVLEVIAACAKASGRPVPYEIMARRPGDVAACYADAGKAERELGWKAEKGLADMCADAWRWQSMNPHGYLALPE